MTEQHANGHAGCSEHGTEVSMEDSLEAHILTPSSGICWSWSGGEGVELAELAFQLPLFCWPPELWIERPTPHAFATTTSSGARRFGFVIGWIESRTVRDGEPHVLVLLASSANEWLYFETLLLAHEQIAGATGFTSLANAADARVAPLLEALFHTMQEQRAVCMSVAEACRESSLESLCRTLRPAGVLNVVLALLAEERIILVASDPLLLFRAAESLAGALAPLEFCGALVPVLPDGLHPATPTLLNEAVEPYVVGLHTTHYAKLKSELDHQEILTVDLDAGTLSGAPTSTAKRRQWLKLPMFIEAARLLNQAVGGSASSSFAAVGLSNSFDSKNASFNAGTRSRFTSSHKEGDVKGHRRSASYDGDTKSHRRTGSQDSNVSAGGCSSDEEDRRALELTNYDELGACRGAVRYLIEKVGSPQIGAQAP